jgi:hypothetical protein
MRARVLVTRNNAYGVHARLLLMRDDGWHVCGVFSLLRPEWLALASICAAHDIEVIHETIPIDADSTTAAQ